MKRSILAQPRLSIPGPGPEHAAKMAASELGAGGMTHPILALAILAARLEYNR
jgi:hypothetical protein